MYVEEYLGEDAYENVSEVTSEETTSSVDTQIKQQRKLIENKKRLDSGYHRRFVEFDGEIKKVETYATTVLFNGMIRHATDGIKCPHRTGTKYEDLYFRVMDVSTSSKESRKLFYYSPEEFERHEYMTVPQSIKEAWNIRNMRANKLYN